MKKSLIVLIAVTVALLFAVSCKSPSSASDQPEIRLSSEFFNPDEEILTIYLPELGTSQIFSWKVEVLEPHPPYRTFHEWAGRGLPPQQIVWDGRNSGGDWVHSASNYPVIYYVSDIHGDIRFVETMIPVDVFVIREDYGKRIMIPTIIFNADSAGWYGLNDEIVANNERILARVAETLNSHSEYIVRVEGHANYTVDPHNIAGRTYEQAHDLQPLSEARARTIVYELVKLGVDHRRLSYYGIGGEHPIADWEDHDSWWKNRRVEFILESNI